MNYLKFLFLNQQLFYLLLLKFLLYDLENLHQSLMLVFYLLVIHLK